MEHNSKITASEMAVLWSAYLENSMADCFVRYLSKVNEDASIEPLFETTFKTLHYALTYIKQLFTDENIPVPMAFNDNDINLQAPRLYSDLFTMRYLKYMAGIAAATYSVALELSARADVRGFFTRMIQLSNSQFNEACELLLKKGAFVRSPIIPVPEKAEYVKKESFLSGLMGQHRPLTAIEISHIGKNVETNSIGRTFVLGFAQVAQSAEVRQYMTRGKEIAEKHETVFRGILVDDDMPLPSTWDSTVTASTTSPFSDRLMMYQVIILNATSVANYGAAIGASMRKDLGVQYSRLVEEILQYADDGVKIMIENTWLEQPPQVPDRKSLTT